MQYTTLADEKEKITTTSLDKELQQKHLTKFNNHLLKNNS